MTRQDIQELQDKSHDPSVSILLPIYTDSAEDRHQTPIRLKNGLRAAEDQLLEQHERRDIEPILARLEQLSNEVDTRQRAQGLALFANKNYGKIFYLPVAVEERTVVNNSFATRDLVVAFARSPRYRVLSLTEKSAHLYEGERDQLRELEKGDFPVTREIPGVEVEVAGKFGTEPTRQHDGEEREYFNRVERALESIAANDPLPLALAGVERTIAYFDEVTPNKDKFNIIARLTGNFENLPLHELEEKIWPLVREHMFAGRKKACERLEEAVGTGRFAGGVSEVWRAANEGRIDTLLVEDDFRQAARRQENGLHLVEDGENGPDVIADVVDEIVEQVLNTSGDLTFLGNGELESRGRIAAILRY